MAQQFQSPVYAPDLQLRQLEMQQRQLMAQRLMEQGSQPNEGRMVSGHYIGPDPGKAIANALATYAGYDSMKNMPKEQAQLMQDQKAAELKQFQAIFGGGGQGGNNPFGAQDMQREAQIAQLIGLDKYAAEKLRQSAPTNEQKNLGFMEPGQRNAAIAAPFLNEMGKDGVQMTMGQNGQVQANAVPGYAGAQAGTAGAVAGAQEAAKSQFDLVDVPDGQGGTIKMPRYKAAQMLNGQQGQGGAQPLAPGQPGGLGTTPSKQMLEAQAALPKVTQQADQMIASIDGVLNHPGLDAGVGLSKWMSNIPGSEAADFGARADQLQGQAFLQAFASLKGGGAITEVEGQKAEQAIARLSRNQSEKAYRESLTELRGILTAAKTRAAEQAGVKAPVGGQQPSRKPVKTGTFNGRKVVQYDDGSVSYAE